MHWVDRLVRHVVIPVVVLLGLLALLKYGLTGRGAPADWKHTSSIQAQVP